jgi:mono/diheme cytochrome c family protein
MRTVCVLILVLLVIAVSVFAGDGAAGQAVFQKACKTCHGAQGQGNPAIAKALNATIPDLGSKEVQARSDAELKKIVTEGNGKMRPVKTISGGEVSEVVSFIRTLKK